MKTKQKVICWLASAVAITALAGCASEDHRGAYGGYERDTGARQERVGDRDIGDRGSQCLDNTGAPYESQHPMPRQQIEHN